MKSQPPEKIKNKTVYVAMSGGVDSSVAAALLKKRGFEITGVYMIPWQPEFSRICPWKEERAEALRTAAVIGIPLLTWDFSKEYKKTVVNRMIREYRTGRTPNPDVMCNKEIKFGLFLKKALKEGADFIATGHYVRKKEFSNGNSFFRLLQAKDKNKDQSYFLWTLAQKQLKYCLFPVGDYIKPEVRKIAKKFGLPNAKKKDSQGICFIGPIRLKDFLKENIKPTKGKIIFDGKTIGEHDGIFYYTIGQRHGLDIKSGSGPYFVTAKNVKKNILYVGREKDLMQKRAKVSGILWIGAKPEFPAPVEVKLRYRSDSLKAVLYKDGLLEFQKPARAVTSGQSAAFYRGTEMLGGGILD